ncbi:hypothetical protein A0U92_03920 [Acetobacter aceti]|uniref:Uncharacterized protein n=1 Tax=Acetobacter aceti TaxID=435 RepID=A0A1U9KE39_ACEAC|nr:hypothetical protein A0U92_03920 [Acetobacter aceti]
MRVSHRVAFIGQPVELSFRNNDVYKKISHPKTFSDPSVDGNLPLSPDGVMVCVGYRYAVASLASAISNSFGSCPSIAEIPRKFFQNQKYC